MKLLQLLFFSVMLSSCSSVPISSMVKLASFDEKDLVNINPNQVRTRITINEPAELQTRDVKLALRFGYDGEEETEYQFILDLLNNKTLKESKGFFSNSPKRHQYEFKIAVASIAEFKKYQREFLKYGKPEKYHWTVYYYLKKRPEEGEPINLDLELKLAEADDYFYLLKSAEMDVE
ncbi:hypothetical protein [Aliikangiella coralliicola]|uniref:Lipoprotein n=1 Tax=Aliikangiella coralliicola TaxID=2592383 RepID=A0A545UA75_9GAMM|nr:hypothetical protein [Aliikangiella coralliicola]TQV86378.1 hypothetical protein FLL46_15765 [Aliikangiella coralliicola]